MEDLWGGWDGGFNLHAKTYIRGDKLQRVTKDDPRYKYPEGNSVEGCRVQDSELCVRVVLDFHCLDKCYKESSPNEAASLLEVHSEEARSRLKFCGLREHI